MMVMSYGLDYVMLMRGDDFELNVEIIDLDLIWLISVDSNLIQHFRLIFNLIIPITIRLSFYHIGNS